MWRGKHVRATESRLQTTTWCRGEIITINDTSENEGVAREAENYQYISVRVQ